MIKKAREEMGKSKPSGDNLHKSMMIPRNPWNFKLDTIKENPKGNDSSTNSSKQPTEHIADKSWNLDESNLEDEINGIP